MKTLTIFTPTYNRAILLKRLYKSLLDQTSKDFMWLIVDDGSIDDTREIVKSFIEERIIEIKYFYQKNTGKPAAHNFAVSIMETDYFVCVDSDDYLSSITVAYIINDIGKMRKNYICGLVSPRSNAKIESWPHDVMYGTLDSLYHKYRFVGDTMLVFKSSVIKQFYFPIFKNEPVLTESVLYEEIDCDYQYLYEPEILYIGEYQKDGISNDVTRYKNNPTGIAYTFLHTAAYATSVLRRAKAYGMFLTICFLLKPQTTFNRVKIDLLTKVLGNLLTKHYIPLIKENWFEEDKDK